MSRPTAPARPQGPRQDLYTRVTDAIVADLETNVRSWAKPWSASHPAGAVTRPLRFTGQPYSGINVLLLWSQAIARGYVAPIWMTFRQALAAGGAVRKGEKGATVVYANHITRTETGDGGEDIERQIGFLKAYTVFNVEQVDGLPARYHALAAPRLDPAQRIDRAEAFFAAVGADIRHGGDMAFYSVHEDRVQLPPFEAFDDPESYYATLAHECTHWTRHPARLDRDFGRTRFGDEGYAREELVAELGAAFLCADLGLELTPRSDHAAYLGHWLGVLKAQPRFIFTAAAHAQRACDYLHARQV
ncbi:antirestriction protein [Phenylobacterium sp. Root77]|uniref:ArdC family protein n=1 Tax=unclassified Phenylobacterium TaxID=2640670 RepID=UPI0006F97BA2|nr:MULTISPECIES: zincin-like metallopeptidase domain-containing protein [unclassified Phenylobacterium]KQW72236.1 antirestriction protein [Phenylobacterium sp. Root1277]KQW95156.1 antirestriction protein [Phenylobacterium sp. Root1290]KRC44849.1 antirestriction protein [Phenylobacterium sp. Root77]